MAARLSTSQIKQVFTFPFQDPKWMQKWLIGVLFMVGSCIIPVIPMLFVFGYFYRIMHRVIHEDGQPCLPEWNDFGKLLKEGWNIYCVYFVYIFPSQLIRVVGYAVYYGGLLYSVTHIRAMGVRNYAILIWAAILVLLMCSALSILLGGLALFFAPPAMCNSVYQDKFTAGFSFSDWWPVFKANFSGFFLGMVVYLGINVMVATCARFLILTLVLRILGSLVTVVGGFYLFLVGAGVFSLAFREGVEKLKLADASAD
jgi:hypothetical protein